MESNSDIVVEEHFHILAVDDTEIDRKILERLLKASSYQVTSVDSGDKALQYLGLINHNNSIHHDSSSVSPNSPPQPLQQRGLKVNSIMTDYCMPGMTGYDLLKTLKLLELQSSQKDIPVVVMSSENVPSRINMCLEGGAEEFLLKPVKLSDLKKLQPHLLKKSIQHQNNILNNNNIKDKVNDVLDETISNCTKSSNNKRKTLMSPESTTPADHRRPNKMEEITSCFVN